jgi:hypothetical protein
MQQTDYLKDITEIRSMMERSSRFISLSGLSGVMAGLYALAGAYVAHTILQDYTLDSRQQTVTYLGTTAVAVLVLAVGTGFWLTTRRARTQGATIWDATARRLLVNLLIPLMVGGLFSLILVARGMPGIIAPSMLIFYGLALVNASKYTLTHIRYLGFAEIGLGLIAAAVPGYSLLFWALGFGVFHIIYGTLMYYTYER